MGEKPVSRTKTSTKKTANQNSIHIKGARANNLKGVDIKIPKNNLVVVTGVSGSGKSSLTMDTLYAEGQRRYVESLSSYARQFLGRMKKPDVDFIHGLCPAIAIEQRVSSSNARSTVGSLTETYDYLRILYARIGKTYSPVSNKLVVRHSVTDVVDFIEKQKDGTKIQLLIPIQQKYDRTLQLELDILMQKGYTRLLHKKELIRIEDFAEAKQAILKKSVLKLKRDELYILIDRFATSSDNEENSKRIADSILTCFHESEGECIVDIIDGKKMEFNNRFEMDGLVFPELTPQLFNYNNPYGACPVCEGYGKILGISADRVIPDKTKSVYDGAIACWSGEKFGLWLKQFLQVADQFDFPIHRPFMDLTDAEQQLVWDGNDQFGGIHEFFKELEQKTYKIQNRVLLARYRGRTTCTSCNGGRLRKEATYVKIDGRAITELVDEPIDELLIALKKLKLNKYDQQVGKRLLLEITNRLEFMHKVGLSYLALNRLSSTLSGGETQRIHLTRTLGSNLTSSMYILDEPSIGLHPKDTAKLVSVLKSLRDLGNTVIVVEHEEDVIRSADYLIDVGPKAGIHGGEIVYNGSFKKSLAKSSKTLTTAYLTGAMKIELPETRRKSPNYLWIKGARQHNLKNIDVQIPLNAFSVITGVSGSGKTTLVKHILYPGLKKKLGEINKVKPGLHKSIEGDLSLVTQIEMISQNPIGKSSRSNPVTYVKAYDSIRKLLSEQQQSKIKGFKPKHFSFNVEGGRCETCKGEGEQIVEMQFLADVRLTCEDCRGQRFQDDVLDVRYKGKNIFDVLNLSIDEALEFFKEERDIIQKITPLQKVGLGYIQLGQSSSTLSGGEAQRVKLASFLGKERQTERILFIFDEPTTGLHFDDINKLLIALNGLVEKGHTVIVVEHNLELIKTADWIVDLGPNGGKEGGHLVFQGSPDDIINCKESHTGQFLKEKIKS